MDRQAKADELKNIIAEFIKSQGLDLVDLIYRYEGRDLFLRILVDRPEGGITIAECTALNHRISNMLDERNILQQRYILEVSSPGLDRPLKTKNDFLRCLNKNVKFFLKEPINGKIEFEGMVTKVENESVYVDIDGDIVEVPLVKINKGKQVID